MGKGSGAKDKPAVVKLRDYRRLLKKQDHFTDEQKADIVAKIQALEAALGMKTKVAGVRGELSTLRKKYLKTRDEELKRTLLAKQGELNKARRLKFQTERERFLKDRQKRRQESRRAYNDENRVDVGADD
ncbi:hypothetical protein GNI_024230 [Gregarina niphandrodes]|uniref:Uncharacterized protein n=1 Tax=Gregarina niphandrodes TaxID=110365 RepID=A0A023BBR8_GRENI|nr:hypothetical protein GNI_024230 [Gregarina niphandrodes]EZG79807.1 hypothetical protein GNI_024230 [Gregarina niphandrodes]|eukprot:XP_011134381.1 hypothetical protein GNI_024230 [Gregarina niphandrodes]